MELLGKTARKFGVKSHTVSQNLDEYLAYRGKNAAYKDWLYKLNRGDQLPRGKFFKGKKAGKPVVIMDEFHMAFKQPSNPFPYQPTGNFDANSLVTKS